MEELNGYWSYARYNPVALMSYEMVSRSFALLSRRSFGLVVCDEAHRLKNLNGRLRQQVCFGNILYSFNISSIKE